MKRKTMMWRSRNQSGVSTLFRKAGAHGKSEKATRRAAKMELWERSLVTRHPAFNRAKDEFESLRSYHSTRLQSHGE